MKYVAVIAIIILAVRVDYWLSLFDMASESLGQESTEVDTNNIENNRELVGIAQNRALKQTSKDIFLALLEDFRSYPSSSTREKATAKLKEEPTMFGQTLDTALEAHVFEWRDLLNNNEPEVVIFLVDLMGILQGENLLMVKRFFSLWMEINMEHFIAAYSLTKDSNCMVATLFGFNIPEAEKLNEYYERQEALNTFLTKENLSPVQKNLATNCFLVLSHEIAKKAPPEAPEDKSETESNQINAIPVEPQPVPDAQPVGVSP